MKLAWSLSCVIVLLYVVQTYCGEGHGKEPQPKLPPTPKIKEEKKEKVRIAVIAQKKLLVFVL